MMRVSKVGAGNELFATCIVEDTGSDWCNAAIAWLRTAHQQRHSADGPVDSGQFEHSGGTADRSRLSFVVARCLRSVAGRFGPRADHGGGKMDRRTTRAGQN